MDNIFFKNSTGLNLSGRFVQADGDLSRVIVMSHGFMGEKEERGRFALMADVLKTRGFSSFLFDFSGCGLSDDVLITVESQVDDMKAAIQFVKSLGYRRIGLLGLSLGGLYCFLAYDQAVEALALWAPVTEGKTPTKLKTPEIAQEFAEKGYAVLKDKQGRGYRIHKRYLEERLAVNQQATLSKVACPVLIIHGAEDEFVPLEHSQNAMQYLNGSSRLWIIEGAKHDLKERLDVVITLTADWFERWIKG
jgi:pimeloyl-ACP methyl ester carboxylesterase